MTYQKSQSDQVTEIWRSAGEKNKGKKKKKGKREIH